MLGPTIQAALDAIERIEIAVDADDIVAVFAIRERLLAKLMTPLRDFDAAQLYQLTKASGSKEFLETKVGLAPAEAGFTVNLARKLGALPETEARWVNATISSGHVRAILANVAKRVLDQFQEFESEILDILTPLTVTEAATAMNRWAIDAHALADDVRGKAPRDDEFFHSKTLGGRYVSNGTSGPESGAVIAKALELAEADNPRDNDTRSPAERRGEALADVAGFYVDYRTRTDTDPDTPIVPKKRNWPQLIGIATTHELHTRAGAQLIDGPRIDATAVEALSCTAQLLRLVFDEHGAIRSYDLLPASVTDALFGACAARDQGCRWPGCHKKPIHCQLHHLHHRAKGGKNSPCNCILFCHYHHKRGAHDKTIDLHLAPNGTLTITYPDGTTDTTIPPHLRPPLPRAG